MAGDKTLLPAERGIGGGYGQSALPGRLIEQKPGDLARRSASVLEKLQAGKDNREVGNGS